MREWDELCVLSGIQPGGGPHNLLDLEKVVEVASTMASEIQFHPEATSPRLAKSDLDSTIKEALTLMVDGDNWVTPTWFSNHIDGWQGSQFCIAIGHFDSRGGCVKRHSRIPSGDDVEIRKVGSGSCGDFHYVHQRGRNNIASRFSECSSRRNYGLGNVFVLEGCWIYLQAWLEISLPSRISPHTGHPLSIAGEFFEIVNSRNEPRRYRRIPGIGTLPAVDYGGIEKTCEKYQTNFLGARRGSLHVGRAIGAGLRGADLFDALQMDFGCWMAVRPDVWPSLPSSPWTPPIFPHAATHHSPTALLSLPAELFLQIFLSVGVSDIMSFASTSKSAWNAMTDANTFNHIVREEVLHGSLRWILPVKEAYDEVESANEVAQKWISTYSGTSDDHVLNSQTHVHVTPFASQLFPYSAFIPECYRSDSMMNRRRLWGIVKQFDVLWSDYRLRGWERDVFIV